jgi:hypothetical protein
MSAHTSADLRTRRRSAARDRARRTALAEPLEARWLLFGGVDRLVNNNNGSTGTGFFTQSETSIIAYGNNVIIGFNDSGSNAAGAGPGEGGGGAGSAGFTGWSRSTDGGNNWTDGGSLPEGVGGHAGDPVLARDNVTGRVYFATLGFTTSTIRVFRSDDNGVSWLPAVTGTPGGSSEDKQWMTVDNFAGAGQGNVYLMSRRFSGAVGMYFYRSINQGGTFSNGTLLWSSPVQGAYVTVGPDHSVYAFALVSNTSIQVRKSTDQGLTFGPAVTVITGQGGGTNGDLALTGMRNGTATFNNFRSNAFPHIAVNPVSGHLYLVYANNPAGTDKADIQLVTSTNGGATWSTPTRVNDDATLRDQWQPTIAITPDGTKLGVFYYSREGDAANNLFRYWGRIATISGSTVTFGASEAISDVASQPEFGRDSLVNSVYMGDYDQAAATSDAFHVVWADNRSALPGGGVRMDPNVYYDRIPLVVPPTVNASNFQFATAPHRISFTFSTNVSASLGTNDILLENLTNSTTIPSTDLSLTYDVGTNTATFSYIGNASGIPQVLPDGDYRATLIASGITDPGGVPLAANHIFNFFFLQGDATHDRVVNLDDFNRLAQNFGQSPRDFTQGDFTYNSIVNLDDFNILAQRFGTGLAPDGSIQQGMSRDRLPRFPFDFDTESSGGGSLLGGAKFGGSADDERDAIV